MTPWEWQRWLERRLLSLRLKDPPVKQGVFYTSEVMEKIRVLEAPPRPRWQPRLTPAWSGALAAVLLLAVWGIRSPGPVGNLTRELQEEDRLVLAEAAQEEIQLMRDELQWLGDPLSAEAGGSQEDWLFELEQLDVLEFALS